MEREKTCRECTEVATIGDRCDFHDEAERLRKPSRAESRKMRESVMKSLGLVKVRGGLGGTYWE